MSLPRSEGDNDDLRVDIAQLSQQKARYSQVQAEESHYLATDPSARDKAIAKLLHQNPEFKGLPYADTFVRSDDDPDVFLAAVDAVLDNPERTIDQ